MAALRVNKSITLIELIIAIILFSAIVLGFSSIDLFSRRQLLGLERQSYLQNEASILITHMAKNIQKAIGGLADFPVAINGGLITIYLDSNGDGLRDKQVAYEWDGTSYQVKYYDDYETNPGVSEVIARNIKTCAMSSSSNYVGLNIVACLEPAETPAYYTNPCITMATQVTMPSVSIN